MAKRIIRNIIKVVASVAGLAALFFPITSNRILLFVGSLVVLLVCLTAWLLLFGDEDRGYWPDKPKQ